MKVTVEEIRKIKPGCFKPIPCEDGNAMYSGAATLSRMQRTDMPEGVVGYEHQKFFKEAIGVDVILIHALKEGEEKVLNR